MNRTISTTFLIVCVLLVAQACAPAPTEMPTAEPAQSANENKAATPVSTATAAPSTIESAFTPIVAAPTKTITPTMPPIGSEQVNPTRTPGQGLGEAASPIPTITREPVGGLENTAKQQSDCEVGKKHTFTAADGGRMTLTPLHDGIKLFFSSSKQWLLKQYDSQGQPIVVYNGDDYTITTPVTCQS